MKLLQRTPPHKADEMSIVKQCKIILIINLKISTEANPCACKFQLPDHGTVHSCTINMEHDDLPLVGLKYIYQQFYGLAKTYMQVMCTCVNLHACTICLSTCTCYDYPCLHVVVVCIPACTHVLLNFLLHNTVYG